MKLVIGVAKTSMLLLLFPPKVVARYLRGEDPAAIEVKHEISSPPTIEVLEDTEACKPEALSNQTDLEAESTADRLDESTSSHTEITVEMHDHGQANEPLRQIYEERLVSRRRRGPSHQSMEYEHVSYRRPLQEWYVLDPVNLERENYHGHPYGQLYGDYGEPVMLPTGHYGWW